MQEECAYLLLQNSGNIKSASCDKSKKRHTTQQAVDATPKTRERKKERGVLSKRHDAKLSEWRMVMPSTCRACGAACLQPRCLGDRTAHTPRCRPCLFSARVCAPATQMRHRATRPRVRERSTRHRSTASKRRGVVDFSATYRDGVTHGRAGFDVVRACLACLCAVQSRNLNNKYNHRWGRATSTGSHGTPGLRAGFFLTGTKV